MFSYLYLSFLDLEMVGMLALSLLIAQAAAMGGFSGNVENKSIHLNFSFVGQWIIKSVFAF